jgi:hypothetical protein
VGPLAGATAGLAGTLLGVALAVLLLRRAQRLRRLERGSPAQRVVGAWWEVLDGLRLAGRPAGPHLAVTEVVGHATLAAGHHAHRAARTGRPGTGGPRSSRYRLRLPAPPLDDLAGLVNMVTFTRASTTEEHARRARAQAVAYVAELRARRPWWRRLLWSVDPRPLRWERRDRER